MAIAIIEDFCKAVGFASNTASKWVTYLFELHNAMKKHTDRFTPPTGSLMDIRESQEEKKGLKPQAVRSCVPQ